MNCPVCNCDVLTVVDSRPQPDSVHRRRKCERCGFRFTTRETIVDKIRMSVCRTPEQKTLNQIKRIISQMEMTSRHDPEE